jgi:hypothetical protein
VQTPLTLFKLQSLEKAFLAAETGLALTNLPGVNLVGHPLSFWTLVITNDLNWRFPLVTVILYYRQRFYFKINQKLN